MNFHQKLDIILKSLYKPENRKYFQLHDLHRVLETPLGETWELSLLVEHLVIEGFISFDISEGFEMTNMVSKIESFRITIKGLLFIEKSSFEKERTKANRNRIWIFTKTVAAVLNALIIVVIGIASVYVANQSNSEKSENKKLNTKVDSLNNTVQSLNFLVDSFKHISRSTTQKIPSNSLH